MQNDTPTIGHTAGPLHADEFGHDDGRAPIVLVHGLTFDRRIWAPVIEALTARDPGRRIIALDLPGHGASPATPPHDLPRVAEVVHEALEAMHATAPLIVGHSMSGALVSIYAARYPTAGVVIVDQLPFIREFAELARRLEAQLRGQEFDQVWQAVFVASFHTELLPADARSLVTSNSQPDQALVLSYWRMVLETPIDELEDLIGKSLDEIAGKDIPCLLVTGSRIPAAMRQALEARLPMTQVVEWPDTGHFPHLARPAQFAELLCDRPAPTHG